MGAIPSTTPSPGADMIVTLLSESARIEALLARLDPAPADACTVAGCVHVHHGHGSTDTRKDPPALAA
jgi:hypothetical protein